MDHKVEDKPKVEDKKVEEVDAPEEKIPPTDLDPIQVEARAYFTSDVFTEPLDKEEVLKNVKERREEREKWEEDQKKKSEKKVDKS